jgi:hypothetical protein
MSSAGILPAAMRACPEIAEVLVLRGDTARRTAAGAAALHSHICQ